MKAVDTNVLARFILQDDAAQADIAAAVLGGGVFVPLTVLLETAWLLRSRYAMSRDQVGAALDVILSLESVEVVDAAMTSWAIERAVRGADIADMLHLVGSRHQRVFATFDADVAKAAGTDTLMPIETLV